MRVQHFDNALSGSEIARLLNEQGVPTKRGKKWSYTTVLRTIRCEFHRFREKFIGANNQQLSLPQPHRPSSRWIIEVA